MKLTFLPMNQTWCGEPGPTVMEIAAQAGVHLDADCAGNGTCGKCKVRVVSGCRELPGDREAEKLTARERDTGYRLACLLRPQVDLVLEVPQSGDAVSRKTAMTESLRIAPAHEIRKLEVEVAEPGLEDQKSFVELVLEASGGVCTSVHPSLYREVAEACPKKGGTLTVTARKGEIIHIEAGGAGTPCCGMSFDIGTTTVVGILWDLLTGEQLGVAALTNPQAAFGADVISRITYAAESADNLRALHNKIITALGDITRELTQARGIGADNIYDIAVGGNTTMCHLFAGVNPATLAKAPFTPVFRGSMLLGAAEIGLPANRLAGCYLLPCIAGHVGADITAGLLTTGQIGRAGAKLFIDVGTNGEIVLSAGDQAVACSTAAGPAFEGSSIHQGMRAADGAVESVVIDGAALKVETIGGAPAVGICGSGIIDAVAALVLAGVVEPSGRIADPDKLRKRGCPEELVARVGEGGKRFVLVERPDGDDIAVTQKDIREVQLAKGAIKAGIEIMLEMLDLTLEQLDEVLIAGAFGNHIRVESAVAIGLIPDVARDKIKFVGNAAGAGAAHALLSTDQRAQAQSIVCDIEHLELSTCGDFQDKYMMAMSFETQPGQI